jgi:hypothetical protein
MIFEDELGIRSSELFRNPVLDVFLGANCAQVQAWEEFLVRQLGFHVSTLRLVVSALLTVPVGVLHRFVPTSTGTTDHVGSSSECATFAQHVCLKPHYKQPSRTIFGLRVCTFQSWSLS